ncbi:D-inositol-3-phosphate glycosyltransferase [subsurface metagenome]
MINTEFNRGGAAKIARTLYQTLNKKDEITCYFAYGRGNGPKEETVYKFAFLPEIYFQGFLTRTTGLQGYGSWFSTKRLEKYIIKGNFDLIHLHNIHGYFLNLKFINFLEQLNISVVWTLHDGWALTGRCAYFFNCEKWKARCKNCPDLTLYPKAFIDSSSFMWKKKKNYFSSGWNPVIVCPSQWLANRVKESYLKKYQVKVIPNAVDIEIFKPKNKNILRNKYEIPTEKKVILCLAADLEDERKGIKYFFKSLKYITAKNWMVVTVGKAINYDKIKEIDIEIKQMGYIKDKNNISDIYNLADIFCISSLDDNFPTTVLEAIACGIPVAGFKVGGIPEQVTEGCGFMVKSKDAKTLGEAMGNLLNNDEMRKIFSENCRKRVLQNYTIKEFADNYMKIYNESLKGVDK